jgi:hypothetical protein
MPTQKLSIEKLGIRMIRFLGRLHHFENSGSCRQQIMRYCHYAVAFHDVFKELENVLVL